MKPNERDLLLEDLPELQTVQAVEWPPEEIRADDHNIRGMLLDAWFIDDEDDDECET